MRLVRGIALLAALLLVSSAASAQFWEKKDYTTWSKDECRKMLEDSPWATRFTLSHQENFAVGQGSSGEGRESNQQVVYTAQIRSALPVRQAVIRLAQINNKYETLPAEQKKLFDESAAAYLARDFSDKVLVHVEFSTNVQFFDRGLAEYWQNFSHERLNRDVYVTAAKDRRVAAAEIQVDKGAGRAFEFAFPRQLNGEPLATSNDKVLRLEFPTPDIRDLSDRQADAKGAEAHATAKRAYFEFKLQKMMHKGQLVY